MSILFMSTRKAEFCRTLTGFVLHKYFSSNSPKRNLNISREVNAVFDFENMGSLWFPECNLTVVSEMDRICSVSSDESDDIKIGTSLLYYCM
jgi:hypothetical protein